MDSSQAVAFYTHCYLSIAQSEVHKNMILLYQGLQGNMPMSWEREDKAEEVLFTDFIGCKIKRKRLHSYWLTQFIDCKHNPIFFNPRYCARLTGM